MSASFALNRALPPLINAYLERVTAGGGGALIPLLDLNTRVPSLGPYVMDVGGAFTLTIYPGPLMHFSSAPALGRHVNVTA
jgi:hypothetical protein